MARAGMVAVLLCLIPVGAHAQVTVEQSLWGFDGRFATSRFTPLSVQLNTASADPIEVEVGLRRYVGIANAVGAPQVEKAFLAPFSMRWVQFYPYMDDQTSSCRLKIGDQTVDIPAPRGNRFQRILLDDGTNLTSAASIVKLFPEQLFPPFVTATDGLQAVFLDHVPKWEEGRRQAFLDWLWLGGHVYLLHDTTGRFPQFSGDLAFLNAPLESFPYGTGRIERLDMPRGGLSRSVLRRLFRSLPGDRIPAAQGETAELPEDGSLEVQRGVGTDAQDEAEELEEQKYGIMMHSDLLSAGRLLPELKRMTRPEHSWLLLHFLFWAYLATIFPGAYLLGLKLADFRWVYAGLGGAVLLFSLAFAIVGHRGYGEKAAVYSTALVRPLKDGSWDVNCWSDAFVTTGGTYQIRHAGQGLLYSTCQNQEAVRGVIRNGSDGGFVVDIPPYSSREFAHRTRVPAAPLPVRMVSATPTIDGLSSLEVEIGNSFPGAKTFHAISGSHIYLLSRDGSRLKLQTDLGTVPAVLGLSDDAQNYAMPNMLMTYDGDDHTQEQRFADLGVRMLVQAARVGTRREARRQVLPPGMVRLCVYADLPPELAPRPDSGMARNLGRAMYVVDVSLSSPEQP